MGSGFLLFKEAVTIPVFSGDVRHDVLVEELQNEGDAVGKHQVLSHVLKLRNKHTNTKHMLLFPSIHIKQYE